MENYKPNSMVLSVSKTNVCNDPICHHSLLGQSGHILVA